MEMEAHSPSVKWPSLPAARNITYHTTPKCQGSLLFQDFFPAFHGFSCSVLPADCKYASGNDLLNVESACFIMIHHFSLPFLDVPTHFTPIFFMPQPSRLQSVEALGIQLCSPQALLSSTDPFFQMPVQSSINYQQLYL